MNFNVFLNHLLALLKRIGFILLLFTFTRILFLFYNLSAFKLLDTGLIVKSFFYGIRFDFIPVFYINIIFIALHLFCFEWASGIIFQKILKGLFIVTSIILLLFNIIDTAYFKYTGKRSGWEMIDMLNTSTDTTTMLPKYIVHYWYLAFIMLFLVFILFRFYPKYKASDLLYSKKKNGRLLSYSLAIVIMLLGFVFARGTETKPIRIITANRYVTSSYIPLLLNTPFTIINTWQQHPEKVKPYFTVEENTKYYSSLHQAKNQGEFQKMNVVIIILESFGKEYVEARTKEGRSFTPFFDSLQTLGLNCTFAFANAKRSIDALPPILGGFPSFLQTSFMGSAYSINNLRGLPSILKENGYSTSFYHGGSNGTMGFDMFCKSIGVDTYYGRAEYNNELDYDGAWGIWDEEFLQYMARNLNETREPFMSALFTLTSHEPYPLPKKYSGKFFPDQPKIIQTIAYTDFALGKFFETISTMKWFRNTLFVICPDHTSVVIDEKYYNSLTNVYIPIIYYCPSDTLLKGNYSKITQQLDIVPSVLDYLNYNKAYISYGKSIFEDGNRFTVSYGDIYQVIDSSDFMLFDGEKVAYTGKYKVDNTTSYINLSFSDAKFCHNLDTTLKAFLNDYYFRLNNNLLADTIEINKYKKPDPAL